MITIFNEDGLMMQKDGAKLIVTDEGYGTVDELSYSSELVDSIIDEYEWLKRMAV